MKISVKILLVSFLAVCGILFAVSMPRKSRNRSLESEIQTVFEDTGMTGLSIAVVKDDSVIYRKVMGYRTIPQDGKKGDLLKYDDLFDIMSVSKTFVATAIMRLVEEKKMKLNDPADKYLAFPLRNPRYPEVPITVKQLLTHTSGLNENHCWWILDSINPNKSKDYALGYSDTYPGEKYDYVNTNYTVLGAVIEGAANKRFSTVIDDIIMKPLGLKGSFNQNVLDKDKFVGLYYKSDKTGKVENNDYVYHQLAPLRPENYVLGETVWLEYPAVGMKITADDLARYMRMHMNWGELDGHRIISKKSEKLIQKNYVGENNYGLSYRQYRDLVSGKVLHGQTGGGAGIKTCMIFDPDEKYGFVILSSGAESKYRDGYGDIHKPLIKALYRHLIANGDR